MNWLANPAGPNYIIALVVVIFVALGYFRWAKAQGAQITISLQQSQITAQDRVITEQGAQIRVLQATLIEQTQRIQLLTGMVQGIPAWDKLQGNYATLELAIKSLDPVIAVFQRHCDEQDELLKLFKKFVVESG